jgi:hypothetical protein
LTKQLRKYDKPENQKYDSKGHVFPEHDAATPVQHFTLGGFGVVVTSLAVFEVCTTTVSRVDLRCDGDNCHHGENQNQRCGAHPFE